ncbi:hypothetical protein L4C34_18820 [Vibrio profundum]|uniref:hypothetical protein n=1 Tax=Vibrio profundum TaxID=2910247 RepID=UPI003D0D2B70
MTTLKAHGQWSMKFKGRVLYSTMVGATNGEANSAWAEEMKRQLANTPEGDTTHWAVLVDGRHWDMASLDSWDSANETITWMTEHNCLLFAVVFARKIQQFAIEQGLNEGNIMQPFFDYEEARQACLNTIKD